MNIAKRVLPPVVSVLCCLAPAIGANGAAAPIPGAGPVLDLRIADARQLTPTHSNVPSVVFRDYSERMPSLRHDLFLSAGNVTDIADEQAARTAEHDAYAASLNSGACLSHDGSDDVGAGLRWSSSDGFGMYWQGRGLRALQHLIGLDEINEICAQGDPSPACKTMPKRYCD